MIRRTMTTTLALAACLAWSPAAFAGEDADARMAALEDRLRVLEDQLAASAQVIDAQREVLAARGPDVAQGDEPEKSFLETIEFGGHVAGSYIYSFNNPATNTFSQTLCQFNCNHNEFSLDAVKLEIGRAAAPGEAGFQFDVLFGQNASIFNALSPDNTTTADAASDTEFFLQQAYLSYNLNGVELKFGKFETLLGYELIDSNLNPNVTQGILFTFAIPLFHTGVLAAGNFSEEFSWAAGFVNGFNNTLDTGDRKGILGQLKWESGPILASYSLYLGDLGETRASNTAGGALVGDDNVQTQIHDFIVQFAPSEATTTWLNVDIGKTEVRPASNPALATLGNDPTFLGVAAGIKQSLSDKMYFAFRGEYMRDDQGSRLFTVNPGFMGRAVGPVFDQIDAFSWTATLGYTLTDNLQARLELRRDELDCDNPSCAFFRDSSDGGTTTNDLGLVELLYSF
jgi:hypothetical protein